MEECVVCLEDCTMDISELRIEDCKCKCKYKIHFDCLTEYLKTNSNKCLYCGEEIFETNIISIPYEPNVDDPYALTTIINNNRIIRQHSENKECSTSHMKIFFFCIVVVILLYIFLAIIL